MSNIFRVLVVLGVVLCLAIGFSPSAMARGEEQHKSPLYILQLQKYAEQSCAKETELLEYRVQCGDNLAAIARLFGSEVETLAHLNNIVNPHLIYAGQTLQVVTASGAVHRVESGETINSIAHLYGVEPETLIVINRGGGSPLLQRGERIIVPGAANVAENISLGWPVKDSRISSEFGWRGGKFHYGVDLAVPLHSPIYAAAAGIVTFSGYQGSYGLMVELDHGGGWHTRYAHAGLVDVSLAEQVSAGQQLAEVGLTGNTTGAHLHFEVIRQGLRIDPLQVLP